jgi:hypothetical protein
MNVSDMILESICLSYQDTEWIQTIDYEHIPFRCHKFHEHKHLFRTTPSMSHLNLVKPGESKDPEGFMKIPNKQRYGRKPIIHEPPKGVLTNNSFKILNQEENPDKDVDPSKKPVESPRPAKDSLGTKSQRQQRGIRKKKPTLGNKGT